MNLARSACVVTLIFGFVPLAIPTSAPGSFPGTPGPIVYQQQRTHSNAEFHRETVGGLVAHGPRKVQAERQITFDPSDADPSYSPNGRWLVFTADRDNLARTAPRIYLMRSDGSGLRPLTSGETADANPSFSPSGRSIVFDRRSVENGGRHIFILSFGRGSARQLTYGPSSDREAVFTPDGRRIVFVSDRDRDSLDDDGDIFAMGSRGEFPKLLIDGPQRDAEPDVSPYGQRIVFVSTHSGIKDIYVADSAGRRPRPLEHLPCGGCYRAPVWAPDGEHIAALRSRTENSAIVVFRANGTRPRVFVAGVFDEGLGGPVMGPPSWGTQSP